MNFSTQTLTTTCSLLLILTAWGTLQYEVASFIPAIHILLSGECHPNPGPNYKFPCGMCQGPCKSIKHCVACDSCDTWYHVKCMNMPLAIFHSVKNTSWICFSCGLSNFSTTLFETHYSDSLATSIATENTYSILSDIFGASQPKRPEPPNSDSLSSMDSSIGSPQHSSSPLKTDAKPVDPSGSTSFCIMAFNFQRMRAKRAQFWLLLEETDPAIIICCETWLHPGIHEREVLPAGYHMVARRDRPTDHHGGVMVAVRDNINSTEISIKTGTELAAARQRLIALANHHSLSSRSTGLRTVTKRIRKSSAPR